MTEKMAELVLQIGVILLVARMAGRLAKKTGIPSVLGELLAGVLIGPYALGGLALPGFENGIFPLAKSMLEGGLVVENNLGVTQELYAFATVASLVLLFASGLETNLGLFLRYSLAGGVIGLCEALVSFAAGAWCGSLLLGRSFMDPGCLFLGVIAAVSSTGITARILSEKKKMDSPEGSTILATAVFEDVPWIILLAVTLGVTALVAQHSDGGLPAMSILGIAGRTFGIWLAVVALGLAFSKGFASFLKCFRHGFDFTILALGVALVLSGLVEMKGHLAMIIGAYVAGLSLSKTDVAAVIQERVRGLYEFFVPVFFAVMGMMVDTREFMSREVLLLGAAYTAAVIVAKVAGCAFPALLFGFKNKGALRIGAGLVPHGEGSLITAGIALGAAAGYFDKRLFSASVLMVLLTIVLAPPLFNLTLKIPGRGTRKPVLNEDNATEEWEFDSPVIADLVMGELLKELRAAEFFVQTMNVNEGLSQARKGEIALFIAEKGSSVTIKTSKVDMPFVKNEIYEIILELSDALQELKASARTEEMKRELLDPGARASKAILSLIEEESVIMELKGSTKVEIITELVDALAAGGKLLDRGLALADVLEREESMSTGMEFGVALPHGRTDGVEDTAVAVGIKREGVNFESMDGGKSRLFFLIVSPKKASGLHIQFLAAVGAIIRDPALFEAVVNAANPREAVELLQNPGGRLPATGG